MTTVNGKIDDLIKIELSELMPNDGVGSFLRELIFSNGRYNWKLVGELMQKHFPEKRNHIQKILNYNI